LAEIWRTRDHLGRVVILTPAGLDHIRVRHGKFANRMDEVRGVVEHPGFVTRDRHHAHRECFYRRELSGSGFIKVVVHYRPAPPQGTWEGEVITAYHDESPEPKEVALWP
jgi:hypothetical protein